MALSPAAAEEEDDEAHVLLEENDLLLARALLLCQTFSLSLRQTKDHYLPASHALCQHMGTLYEHNQVCPPLGITTIATSSSPNLSKALVLIFFHQPPFHFFYLLCEALAHKRRFDVLLDLASSQIVPLLEKQLSSELARNLLKFFSFGLHGLPRSKINRTALAGEDELDMYRQNSWPGKVRCVSLF